MSRDLLPMPDVTAGVVQRIKDFAAGQGVTGLNVTSRFPVSPALKMPLVAALETPGSVTTDPRYLFVINYEVSVWAETRSEARSISDVIRRALCAIGGFPLDAAGTVVSGSANPLPYHDDSLPVDSQVRFIGGYDLTVRLTEGTP